MQGSGSSALDAAAVEKMKNKANQEYIVASVSVFYLKWLELGTALHPVVILRVARDARERCSTPDVEQARRYREAG